MKIAYLTTYDVLNQAKWPKYQSGLCAAGYFLARTLEEQNVKLDLVGPLEAKNTLSTRIKRRIYTSVLKKQYYHWTDPAVLRNYANQALQKMSQFKSDAILCPENSLPISYLDSHLPIILWSDATLYSLINFYPYLSNLCRENFHNITAMEKAALDRCEMIIYTSDWAAQTAIDAYGVEPSKVRVIPWGANIECDRSLNDVNNIVEGRNNKTCKLLFFAVEWLRKGGDVALAVTKALNETGLPTELTVVGCHPPESEILPDYVTVIGYINKSTADGRTALDRILADSHFLILPTRADCAPHVLIEANSFGVPCLTTNVGGIKTIVKDDVNGKVVELDTDISEYCTYVTHLFEHYERYKALANSSFYEYEIRLNWNVAAKEAKKLIMDLI
ncbi:glycosyltransferase family 4 protein [Chroococcidiopsidales cyanobacterium LEGE 13417]|nr:glycosyltransferase family 4 protein [Chroococcidiopsidales cyanobacterium LEGE 13417]